MGEQPAPLVDDVPWEPNQGHLTGDGAPYAVLLLQLAEPPRTHELVADDWSGWDDHEWRTARTSLEGNPRIRNVFTADFLTSYVGIAKHRPVGFAVAVDTPSTWRSELDTVDGRVVGLDVITLGQHEPEWFVLVRIEAAEPMPSRSFARLVHGLARTEIPTFDLTAQVRADLGDGPERSTKVTPHVLMLRILRTFLPAPIAASFAAGGAVDSRAKVFAYMPHDDADVHTPQARQAALDLAGGVHSTSGMLLDGMIAAGQALTLSLHRNWSAVMTLDGVGYLVDPEDGFARVTFRKFVREAYWLAYADALADVASVDRYLRRPALNRGDRRALLQELEDFSELSRQWSARGTNTFPVPMSIRTSVEQLHGTAERMQLAQRRSESISSGFLTLANHRFNRILTLVAVLTAGQVMTVLADAFAWFEPFALTAFFGLLAVLMLLLRGGGAASARIAVGALLAAAAVVGAAAGALPGWMLALLSPGGWTLIPAGLALVVAAVSLFRHPQRTGRTRR